jgi:hypothetical protein
MESKRSQYRFARRFVLKRDASLLFLSRYSICEIVGTREEAVQAFQKTKKK